MTSDPGNHIPSTIGHRWKLPQVSGDKQVISGILMPVVVIQQTYYMGEVFPNSCEVSTGEARFAVRELQGTEKSALCPVRHIQFHDFLVICGAGY